MPNPQSHSTVSLPLSLPFAHEDRLGRAGWASVAPRLLMTGTTFSHTATQVSARRPASARGAGRIVRLVSLLFGYPVCVWCAWAHAFRPCWSRCPRNGGRRHRARMHPVRFWPKRTCRIGLARRSGPCPCHICTGTGLTPATSAPGLGSPVPHLHQVARARTIAASHTSKARRSTFTWTKRARSFRFRYASLHCMSQPMLYVVCCMH